MYIDFSQTNEFEFEADICVIGAGAAGFSCAVTLLSSGLKVLVLEGGLKKVHPKAAEIHQGEVVNHPHIGIHEARERVVGGTTTKWGGQAFPFLKEDFEERTYMNMSGWPISFEDIEPYYNKAEAILGTDNLVPFQYRPWKDTSIDEPQFTPSTIDLFVTKWCKVPNFALQHGYKIEQSENVILLRNANVVELLPNEDLDAVKALKIRSLDGKEGMVNAKYVIAAGGAMETVRLFLVYKKFGQAGLGNSGGLVGRYFQDHCAAIVGQIYPASRKRFHSLFDPFYKNGFKYFPRIKLDPSFANKSSILHASAQVVFSEKENGVLDQAKMLIGSLRKKELPSVNIIKALFKPSEFFSIAKAAWRWKVDNRGSSSDSGPIWLEIHSEQEPVYESSVQLGQTVDALGMPRIRLDWKISDLTVTTIKTMAALVREELKRTGVGEVVLEPWVTGETEKSLRWITDTFHQAGGLKMAGSEQDGVVDSSCKVFGIQNLYVASSAVFPTSSFSNPTMTTIALSIRICESVKERIKHIIENQIPVNG